MIQNISLRKRAARTKRGTLKKRGGAAVVRRHPEVTDDLFERLNINHYYKHALIVKDYFIKRKVASCADIPKENYKVYYINQGYNGFLLQFVCGGVVSAVKIFFNKGYLDAEDQDYFKRIIDKIRKEYENIGRFDHCKYIVKTIGNFIFNGEKNLFWCRGNKPYDTDVIIEGGITGARYKSIKKDGITAWLEPFAGVIMEYIDYSLSDIAKHLLEKQDGSDKILVEVRILIFLELFFQYLHAINCINQTGYVHTDIKLENLMYKRTDDSERFEAKIVDLSNIKNYKTDDDITTNSQIASRLKQYHTGALTLYRSIRVQLKPPSGLGNRPVPAPESTKLREKKIKDIAERYDLYCLCITFRHLLREIKGGGVFDIDTAIDAHQKMAMPAGAAGRTHVKRTTRLQNAKEGLDYFEAKMEKIYNDVDIDDGESLLLLDSNITMGKELYPYLLEINPKIQTPRFW